MSIAVRGKPYIRVPYEVWRLQRSGLPTRFRGGALRGLLRLNLLHFVSPPNPVRLLNYRISYFDAKLLRHLFYEVMTCGAYRFSTNSNRPFILDCGSNIGMSVLFFKKLYPGARIVGFEPDPATYGLLRQNVEQNHLADVTVHNCALSDHEGEAEFHIDPDQQGSLLMSLDDDRCHGETVSVPCRQLSSFVTGEVDLLKMDIEGEECRVLPELAASGKLALIRRIHLEYHHHITGGSDHLSDLLRLLEDHGFGYQIQANPAPWAAEGIFQDIAIYAYQKSLH